MLNYFKKLVEDTLKIVAIDSVQSNPCDLSPFGKGVGVCIEEVLKIATNMGFETHNECGYYGIATIGKGEEFGILGHLDVVPYKDQKWTKNPLGEIDDKILYGRGVLDDKGPILACLYATYQLLQEGYKLKRKIKFIFGGNEESGWKCIERYNSVDKMPKLGFSPDASFPVINCEKGIVDILVSIPKPKSLIKLKGGERSNVVMDKCEAVVNKILNESNDSKLSIITTAGHTYISSIGTPAHGSTPEKGDNAFLRIIKFLAKEIPEEYTKINYLFSSLKGEGLNIKLSDEKSGDLTCNIGKVSLNGENIELTINIRFPVSYTKEHILKSIKKATKGTCTILAFHDPLYVSKDDNLVQSLLKAYTSVTKKVASPISIGGGTYARALSHGVAFGPVFKEEDECCHEADEHISLQNFKLAYDIYYEAIKSLCFK